MKCKNNLFHARALFIALTALSPLLIYAQWLFIPQTTPDAQRNALTGVRMQVNWFQNSTQTSGNFAGAQGYVTLRQQFDGLRAAYNALKHTLNSQQLAYGANDFADLDAGLNIVAEAFANFEEDIAAGDPPSAALRNLSQVLRKSSAVWLQELNKIASRLRIGWG